MSQTTAALALQKICVKLYATDPGAVELPAFVPVFHGWIQFRRLDGLLIDVADYSHVKDGPGVLLVAYEADYYIDESEGPLGLLYSRKAPLEGSLPERITSCFRAALTACKVLEGDAKLKGKLKFRGEKARLILNDRLAAPNSDETLAVIRADLDAALETLYPGQSARVERDESDPRRRFTLDIRTDEPVDVDTLLQRLG